MFSADREPSQSYGQIQFNVIDFDSVNIYDTTMSGALEGIRVLELGGIGPSPYACMLLADHGADVLRLERGDPNNEGQTSWRLMNRSRPSVAIDLKSPAGRDLVLELVEKADAVVEGFRPGVAERLGVGPDECRRRNPRLVYARMTGYGQSGPLAQRAGHDINYLAVSGALWPLGRASERPVPPLNLVADFGGGSLFLVFGILSALLHARTTGEGQVVDVAMVDGATSLTTMLHAFLNAGNWLEERGMNTLDTGAPFYEVYETLDGRYIAVGALEPQFYAEFLLGLDLDAEEFGNQMDRERWPEMKRIVAGVIATKTRNEWTSIFEERDACVTPVLSPLEARTHPYNTSRGVFTDTGVPQPVPAPRFSNTPGLISRPPDEPGGGTREGLLSWGITLERQVLLREDGAFG